MNGVEPSGLYFLDTNIFASSFDSQAPQKQRTALQLIQAALTSQRGIISTQVVQEFLNIALRKFARPMLVPECRAYLSNVLIPLCLHFPSGRHYDLTLLIKEETGFSFYDALMVTAALESGCSTFLSEDLQDGRVVQGMRLINPFL